LKTKEESAGCEAATMDMIANHIAGYSLRSVSILPEVHPIDCCRGDDG